MTPLASGDASASGKSERTWNRTGPSSVEEAGDRLDDDPTAGTVDRAYDVGDHRDEILARAAAHDPDVVETRRERLGDRPEGFARGRLDPEVGHLVVVELVVRRRGKVPYIDEDPASDDRLCGVATRHPVERGEDEAAAVRRRRDDAHVATMAVALEHDERAGAQARRGRLVDTDADEAAEGVGGDDLADGDRVAVDALTCLR